MRYQRNLVTPEQVNISSFRQKCLLLVTLYSITPARSTVYQPESALSLRIRHIKLQNQLAPSLIISLRSTSEISLLFTRYNFLIYTHNRTILNNILFQSLTTTSRVPMVSVGLHHPYCNVYLLTHHVTSFSKFCSD